MDFEGAVLVLVQVLDLRGYIYFFFQAEDGIRDPRVTGVQTCALPICREVTYQGHKAVQHVAEAEVVLDRPAWRHRRRGGRVVNERVPGPPITLRLVVSRACDPTCRTLAVWYL